MSSRSLARLRSRASGAAAAAAAAILLCATGVARAAWPQRPPAGPPPPARGVGVTERLGETVPPDLVFTDAGGRPASLGRLVGDGARPTVLVLAYERCPLLCGLILGGLADAASAIDWTLGREYRAVTVSLDPAERPATARRRQAGVLDRVGRGARPEAWPFLVGDEATVRALAAAVGFGYRLDPATNEYDHPAVAIVLTPDGRVSRYLHGYQVAPRDLELALVEASEGRTGTTLDRIILRGYRYDPATRRYEPAVLQIVEGGVAATLFAIAAFVFVVVRRDLERRARELADRRRHIEAAGIAGGAPA